MSLRRLVAAACAVWIVGCGHSIPSAVSLHERQWQAHRLADYSYVYEFGAMMGNVHIKVVVNAERLASMTPIEGNYRPLVAPTTIDDLFAQVRGVYRSADAVTVTYDPTYGFRTHVGVDPSKRMIDDEYEFGVAQFHPGR